MGRTTDIEWTDYTCNVVTGCDEVSPGCDLCYAKTLAERFRGTAGHFYERGFEVVLRPQMLSRPATWKAPADLGRPLRIFVCSMSDLFHDEVPDEYLVRVFVMMATTPQHIYQVLTKRPRRMRSLINRPSFRDAVLAAVPAASWPLPNVWLIVSVEDQKRADLRIPILLDTLAAVRGLSMEPLLGSVQLRPHWTHGTPNWGPDEVEPSGLVTQPLVYTPRVDWIIVGGESGAGARIMQPGWARSLRDQAVAAEIPFFFKQWGAWAPTGQRGIGDVCSAREALVGEPVDEHGHREIMRRMSKKASGKMLDGRTWLEFPPSAPTMAVATHG